MSCQWQHTLIAALVAYQMAPAMLTPSPTTFHLAYLKSPNETAPMRVIMMFFRLPATLVVRGSLYRVQMNVEWLIVSPSTVLSKSVTCAGRAQVSAMKLQLKSAHTVWLLC